MLKQFVAVGKLAGQGDFLGRDKILAENGAGEIIVVGRCHYYLAVAFYLRTTHKHILGQITPCCPIVDGKLEVCPRHTRFFHYTDKLRRFVQHVAGIEG